MSTQRSIAAFAVAICLVGVLGACSDDDKDGPPATETPDSVVEDVAVPTETPTPDSVGDDPADTSGVGAINGPATVDSSFSGANPDGGAGGG